MKTDSFPVLLSFFVFFCLIRRLPFIVALEFFWYCILCMPVSTDIKNEEEKEVIKMKIQRIYKGEKVGEKEVMITN